MVTKNVLKKGGGTSFLGTDWVRKMLFKLLFSNFNLKKVVITLR